MRDELSQKASATAPALVMSLVVSHGELYRSLDPGATNIQRKMEAIEAIRTVANLDYSRSVGVVASALSRDRSWEVRQAAAAVLAQVAQPGDFVAASSR